MIDFLSRQVKGVEQQLSQLSVSSHGNMQTPFLIQMAGIGMTSAMTILSAIGDIHRLAQRIGKLKAIVAVARRILVAIWHVLTKQEADHNADPQTVHRAFLRWGTTHKLERTNRLTRHEFANIMMARVGLSIESVAVIA